MRGKLLERPRLLYLVNPPDLDGTGVWPLFRKITPSENSSLKEIKRFNQKDGKWVFSVYKQCYKFDFIDNFTKAKIKKRGSETAAIEDFFVKGYNKKVIFSHPLSEIRYDLKLPENPFIKFSIGIAENSWDKTDGVLGKIYIISDGKETEIFSKYLNPQYNLEDRKWLDYEIDLSRFSNKKVSIVFKTFPGPIAQEEGDYTADWWGWGEPMLIERYEEIVVYAIQFVI